MQLQLNKKSNGYYSSTHGNMTVTVSDISAVVGGNSQWQITIMLDDEIVFDEWAKTKKDCYALGVKFLTA